MKVTLKQGTGYYRLNKYPYGGDFRRLSEPKQATLIAGTVKNASQIRFMLDDGTIGITDWSSSGLPIEQMPNIFDVV